MKKLKIVRYEFPLYFNFNLLTDFKKGGGYQFIGIFFFLCLSISFLPYESISRIFLLERAYLSIGPTLIWSSSEYDQ